ncbi:2-oxoisovalerate dehydrogenase subunit alpha, mitochondrial [Planococcus citri]|uniref:2-oxoisovalerate dehydrogenase subunit alpha, mitochondrial n=1 Tax=Planococcus citri TaxID=170843 RepID=UPI0031F9DA3B
MFSKYRNFQAVVQPIFRRLSTALKTDEGVSQCNSNYTSTLNIHEPGNHLPIFRILNEDGQLNDPSVSLNLDEKTLISMYKCMVSMKETDKILYECQRQGRISFYMTHYGEEAASVGSAAALNSDDLVFSQYREVGVLHWRGVPLDDLINQCFGNEEDLGKGKQMPIHYGSKQHSFVTISSPLATQIPQAVGAAYAFKRAKNDRCVITYFGEGAASEGDAHAAFNFAATLECPVIFFCRNNQYAISTCADEQYRGDGIAGRAAGYGISAIKVDGNDIIAVYQATKLAREFILKNNKPIVMEALTYRKGHHSTSDDSTAYRSKTEIENWESKDPLRRLKLFLQDNNWWNEELENAYKSDIKKRVLSSMAMAEKKKKPNWKEMFNDVYNEMPENLKEQMKYMEDHLSKYNQHYPLENFKS